MALISHVVCFVDDVEARRAFYEPVLRRNFKGTSKLLRCECWFIAARCHAYEIPGWNVYFAVDSIDKIARTLDGAIVHRASVDDTEFAFVVDPILGAFALQQGDGGDASARFETPTASVALERLDRVLGIYVERDETAFATTYGVHLEVPSLAGPRWLPVWHTPRLEAVVARAVKLGARVSSVDDDSTGASVLLVDPWGAELVIAGEPEMPEDLPDLVSVRAATCFVDREAERAMKAAEARAERVRTLRAKWIRPQKTSGA